MSLNNLKPLDNTIIFKFLNYDGNNSFSSKTSWGFEIKDEKNDVKENKWGKVLKTGPDVIYVKEGDFILIDSLHWSNVMEYCEDKYWSTKEQDVILVSDKAPNETI